MGCSLSALPLFLASLLLGGIAVAQVPAIVVHVAPSGDDEADGLGADRAVRSLERGRDLLRSYRLLSSQAGVGGEVVLHAGVHRLTAPLEFGPEDGGGSVAPVVWRAADGTRPVISGGRLLEEIRVVEPGLWEVALDGLRPRELFVDGARQPRSRTPNEGWLRIEAPAADKRSGFTFSPGDLQAVPDLAQVELLFLHDWSITRVGVAELDVAARRLVTTDPIGAAARHYAIDWFEPHPRYRLEGSVAFLDRPGEWCLVPERDALLYKPAAGQDPDRATLTVPVAGGLIRVHGSDGQPVRRLHFQGLSFCHAAWEPPVHGYAEGQANFHEPRADGETGILRRVVPVAVEFEQAEDCALRHCEFSALGTGGVRFGSRTRGCVLSDSRIDDVASNGVLLGEDSVRRVEGRPWWRVAAEQAASDHVVEGCTITRCGQLYLGAVGVWVGIARDCRIAGNEVAHLPYTGISLGWVWNPEPTPVGGLLVEDNHIHHVMQQLSDGGGIYTLGRQPGTRLVGNRIHDIPVHLGRAESNGMFLDQGTTDLVIEDNVIWNLHRSPLRFHQATTNLVRGNLLVVRGEVPAIRYNATDAELIEQIDNVVARQ